MHRRLAQERYRDSEIKGLQLGSPVYHCRSGLGVLCEAELSKL